MFSVVDIGRSSVVLGRSRSLTSHVRGTKNHVKWSGVQELVLIHETRSPAGQNRSRHLLGDGHHGLDSLQESGADRNGIFFGTLL